ncbi:MAG: hypothetical protein V3R78_14315 [Thermodesulfobacteriota bacterium]
MYLVVVDTDKYSGNFEREMSAYITGVVGECEVGLEEKNTARKELGEETIYWFVHNISQMPDEHNVSRPCAIRPTPGWFNDGVGNHWQDGADPNEVRRKKIKWSIKYYTPLIERAKKNIADGKHAWRRDLKGYGDRLEAVKSGGSDSMNFQAYQSVAIFFNSLPPDNIMEVIIKRAEKFSESKGITIENFQLIHVETVETVVWKGLKRGA